MPIDEHAWATITSMPVSHQILVPGRELLGVGGAGGSAFSPDLGEPNAEDGVGHLGNGSPHGIFGQKAVVGVEQVTVTLAMVARTRPLEANIRTESIEAEQQAFLNRRPIQILAPGQAFEVIGKLREQVRFLE